MNGVWKTFLIYLPFLVILMMFYWSLNEVTIEYPIIKINRDEILYDINYKYKTTLIPFIYDFTKEGRNTNYTLYDDIEIYNYKLGNNVTIDVSDMKYKITEMNIVYEGDTYKKVYSGNFKKNIKSYLKKEGIYRVSLSSKLYRRFYYDGYIDYEFKIKVVD